MKLLLWNVNCGPKPPAIDWLAAQEWDVAVLLEVSEKGGRLLGAAATDPPVGAGWGPPLGTLDTIERSGRRYGVATLSRASITLGSPVKAPVFTTRGGRYAERSLAVEVVDPGGEAWTIVGLHMPNSVAEGRRKDHSFKEDCFRELRYWIAQRPRDERLAIAMDSNRSSWELSETPLKRRSIEVQTFLRRPDLVGLQDAFVASDPAVTKRPETYWQSNGRGEYFDRVFVNRWVEVDGCEVALPKGEVGRRGKLSDHAPVIVDLHATTG